MLQTAISTSLALLAFAANSLLCRFALAGGGIDPASFTLVRLAAGAATLGVLVRGKAGKGPTTRQSWTGAILLVLYAAPFAFAYRDLTAGTGALLLFGAVQVTMLVASFRAGHAPSPRQWLGLLLAFAGLTYLVLPGVTAPSLRGATLMIVAGIAWGLYTINGRSAQAPLGDTAINFVRSLPIALLVAVVAAPQRLPHPRGLALAALSGALASGVGYVLWYRAVSGLSTLSASVVQLAVPVLAAAGGIALLGEALSWRLEVATLLILGGIAIAVVDVRRVRSLTAT